MDALRWKDARHQSRDDHRAHLQRAPHDGRPRPEAAPRRRGPRKQDGHHAEAGRPGPRGRRSTDDPTDAPREHRRHVRKTHLVGVGRVGRRRGRSRRCSSLSSRAGSCCVVGSRPRSRSARERRRRPGRATRLPTDQPEVSHAPEGPNRTVTWAGVKQEEPLQWRGSSIKRSPAVSYSPTRSPLQYHRR